MPPNDALTEREIRVLIALEQEPLGTFEEIAHLTDYSKSGVFNIYQKLTDPPSDLTNNEDPICSVTATPNLESLGLEIVDVLIEIPPTASSAYLYEFCQEHPYTLYYSYTYGSINGFFLQFRIPHGTREKIVNLLNALKYRGKIQSFTLYNFPSNPIYTTTQVEAWNHAGLRWNFDVQQWFNSLEEISVNVKKKSNPSAEIGQALSWMKKIDLFILIGLMENARAKNVDSIAKIQAKFNCEINRQTYSRRSRRLIDECITGHRVQIRSRVFDIHNPTLIIGTGDPEFIRKLANFLVQNPIPFTSTFKHNETTIFWYIHLPSTHLADLLYNLRQKLVDLQVCLVDHPRSLGFNLYPGAFNEETKSWRSDDLFMIEDVLAYMDKWDANQKLGS